MVKVAVSYRQPPLFICPDKTDVRKNGVCRKKIDMGFELDDLE
jgi:hypothetical protein